MKPVRLLCYIFFCGPESAQRWKAFLSWLYWPIKNVALIYSVTFCQQKTKDCALSGCFQHKLQHCYFYHWRLSLFITILEARKPKESHWAYEEWASSVKLWQQTISYRGTVNLKVYQIIVVLIIIRLAKAKGILKKTEKKMKMKSRG